MLHPALGALAGDLDVAGVRWTLLRLPSAPHAPTGDVDLLVDPRDADRLDEVLAGHGFVPLPGWTDFPAKLYVGVDDRSGQGFLLDVTDRVAFGPGGLFATDAADRVLVRRRQAEGVWLPADDDGFWALLLHCLLDKGRVPEHYRGRLTAAAPAADLTHPLARRVVGAGSVVAAVRTGDWPAVEAAAAPTAAEWRRSVPTRQRVLAGTSELRRRARAGSQLRRRFGVSVALLGPNGAGKSTLAEGITSAWPLPVRRVYLGLWKSGDDARPEIPGLAQALRLPTAWLRYLTAAGAQLRGHLVVFDRYVHDARRPPTGPYLPLKRVYLWVLAHCVPHPDVVLLLDLPGAVSYARKAENSVAEGDLERAEFRAIAAQLPGVHVIDATQPADAVRADAMRVVWARCRRRWGHPAESVDGVVGR